VYGLREALRLVREEGLEQCWARHERCGQMLRYGLVSLGLEVGGDLPYSIVYLPPAADEAAARHALLADFGINVTQVGPRTWRLGLLAAAARPENVHLVLAALERVLQAA
jgi:alanine-glyoxylate transaminase/serine-glyoxylate transaminase/serine-pyruvate transaminase